MVLHLGVGSATGKRVTTDTKKRRRQGLHENLPLKNSDNTRLITGREILRRLTAELEKVQKEEGNVLNTV